MNKQQNPQDVFSALISGLTAADYYQHYFEKKPLSGKSVINLDVTFEDIFEIIHIARANHDVVFSLKENLDPQISEYVVDTHLSTTLAHPPSLVYRELFEANYVSIIIKNISRYVPNIAGAKKLLSSVFEGKLTDVCIITPPNSSTGNIHYDDMEVFNFNVLGTKTWDLYNPIEYLPNKHIYKQTIEGNENALNHYSTYLLNAGDCLYVPRGWIHKVKNNSAEPTLQIGVTIIVDSWIGVFSNILNYAYSRISVSSDLRHLINQGNIESQDGINRILLTKKEFDRYFFEAMSNGLMTNQDFIHNQELNNSLVNAARLSIKHLANSLTDTKLVPSGARYLIREYNASGFLAISSNENDYFYIPASFWEELRKPGEHTIRHLQENCGFSENELIKYIDMITNKLGIYKFKTLD